MPRLPGPTAAPALALALALAVALAAALPGCLEPHRVRVDPDALARIPRDWQESRGKPDSDGWLGPKSVETLYTFDAGASTDPPFDAFLQVFSLRELDRRSTEALQRLAEGIVEEAAADKGIALEEGAGAQGTRKLAHGVATRFTVRQGTVVGDGDLFSTDSTVRIVAEVGHDGRSKTSFIAVGMAQVETRLECPLIGPCQVEQDETTWIDIVADPAGSLGPAGGDGMIHNLETR